MHGPDRVWLRAVVADGSPGDPVLVTEEWSNDSELEDVPLLLSDGQLLMAWEKNSWNPEPHYFDWTELWSRRYDASLAAVTPATRIANVDPGLYGVVQDGAGHLLVAREDYPSTTYLRTFDLDLQPVGGTEVPCRWPIRCLAPRVYMQPDGDSVVLWNQSGDQAGFRMRGYTSDLVPATRVRRVVRQEDPDLRITPHEVLGSDDGGAAIVWQLHDFTTGYPSPISYHAQMVDTDLQPIAESVEVLDEAASERIVPVVDLADDGRLLVAWIEGDDVRARWYDTRSLPISWWRGEGDTSDSGDEDNEGTASGGVGYGAGACG